MVRSRFLRRKRSVACAHWPFSDPSPLSASASRASARAPLPWLLLTGKCAKANLDLVSDDGLTLATDNPAFPPWWGGNAGRGFETSNPYSGKGYESAVAYEVAKRLGFTKAEVDWKVVPFVKSYAPGKKTFDFYMAQVWYSPVRAKAVDFANSHDFVNQAVVGIKGTAITRAKSIRALKPYTLGAAIGTTSYSYITRYIKPTEKPKVYDTNSDAITALKNKQIDGLVVDFPSTGYITGRTVADLDRRRSSAHEGDEGALRHGVREGLDARFLRESGVGRDAGEWDVEPARETVACGRCAAAEGLASAL